MDNTYYYINRVRFRIHRVFKFPSWMAKHKNIINIFINMNLSQIN